MHPKAICILLLLGLSYQLGHTATTSSTPSETTTTGKSVTDDGTDGSISSTTVATETTTEVERNPDAANGVIRIIGMAKEEFNDTVQLNLRRAIANAVNRYCNGDGAEICAPPSPGETTTKRDEASTSAKVTILTTTVDESTKATTSSPTDSSAIITSPETQTSPTADPSPATTTKITEAPASPSTDSSAITTSPETQTSPTADPSPATTAKITEPPASPATASSTITTSSETQTSPTADPSSASTTESTEAPTSSPTASSTITTSTETQASTTADPSSASTTESTEAPTSSPTASNTITTSTETQTSTTADTTSTSDIGAELGIYAVDPGYGVQRKVLSWLDVFARTVFNTSVEDVIIDSFYEVASSSESLESSLKDLLVELLVRNETGGLLFTREVMDQFLGAEIEAIRNESGIPNEMEREPGPSTTTTTTTEATTAVPTDPDDSLPGWAIALIVIGSLLGVAIIAAAIYFLCIRKKKKEEPSELPSRIMSPSNQYEEIPSRSSEMAYDNAAYMSTENVKEMTQKSDRTSHMIEKPAASSDNDVFTAL